MSPTTKVFMMSKNYGLLCVLRLSVLCVFARYRLDVSRKVAKKGKAEGAKSYLLSMICRGCDNRTDNFLILRIVPQRIPILIAFEPVLVFISQFDRPPQPLQSLVALAFHCVGRSQPVSRVMIGVGVLLY